MCMSLGLCVCVCVCVCVCTHGVGVRMHAIFHASVSVCFLLDGFKGYSEAREDGMPHVP